MKIFLFLLVVVAVILAWRFYPVNSWDKTFPKSDNVTVKKVKFKNRYGIELVGDLYIPKNKVTEKSRRRDTFHRRDAHHDRRGQRRGRDRRGEPAQARAGARRAANDWRDDTGGIPQVYREGRRARAALPSRDGPRAGPRDRLPGIGAPPRRAHLRRRDPRGGGAFVPLSDRPVPAGQGARPARRERRAHLADRWARLRRRDGEGEARRLAGAGAGR